MSTPKKKKPSGAIRRKKKRQQNKSEPKFGSNRWWFQYAALFCQ